MTRILSEANRIVTRLVLFVAALNVVVLMMLAVVELTPSADVQTGADSEPSTDDPTAQRTVEPDDTETPREVSPEPDEPGVGEIVDETPTISPDPPRVPDRFVAAPNEVQSEAKELGTAVAHAMTNYEVGSSLADVLATLPSPDPAFADGTSQEVRAVHHPDMWSRGTVEYAQLGGHLNGRISIIVVIRQELGLPGSAQPVRTEKRTMEVRLARDDSGAWALETVASAGGRPVERPADLSPLAAAVVDNERIDLPDTGAWDIYSGYIDPALLQYMLDMAERTPYSVVVLQTGHSYNVFGTERVSNHSVGRAVDIYKLETEYVIDSHHETSQIYALASWVVTRSDVKEFGSPWLFPDAVVHTFTNEVHHDHLHIGVFAAPAPQN